MSGALFMKRSLFHASRRPAASSVVCSRMQVSAPAAAGPRVPPGRGRSSREPQAETRGLCAQPIVARLLRAREVALELGVHVEAPEDVDEPIEQRPRALRPRRRGGATVPGAAREADESAGVLGEIVERRRACALRRAHLRCVSAAGRDCDSPRDPRPGVASGRRRRARPRRRRWRGDRSSCTRGRAAARRTVRSRRPGPPPADPAARPAPPPPRAAASPRES